MKPERVILTYGGKKLIRANGNQVLTQRELNSMIRKLEKLYTKELQILGFDQNTDYNLKETPLRKAKMIVNEKFRGCFTPMPKITVFPNQNKEIPQLVMAKNIKVKSTCSHHFADIMGLADIGIVYNEKVLGLSKFARIVDWYSRRGQIQEELCNQILDTIMNALEPFYVILRIKAKHNCIAMRGAENEDSYMITTGERYKNTSHINVVEWRNLFYHNLEIK